VTREAAAREGNAVIQRIERDNARFKEIVRGKIRQNLRKYVSRGELIGRHGKDLVSIPVPQIEIPHFRHGQRGHGGVGQGDGDVGDPIGVAPGSSGSGQAGDRPGTHLLEVEIELEELAQILGEELQLPRIEPKGKKNIVEQSPRYTSIRQAGPESLRHFKRTYKRALRRIIASQEYDPNDPKVIPIREDKRYRARKWVPQPQANAVLFYMMDVSGSMTDEQKEIVRITAFWIDTWLRANYHGIEVRYIVHDAEAKEVDRETFYHLRESGGTRISSAYKLCAQIIDEFFPWEEWNIYAFHFSDGDNWGEDNSTALEIAAQRLVPRCNLFCYGQVESPYGSGLFLHYLEERFRNAPNVCLAEIPGRDAIYDAIKTFLGKGR
jgi:uncharacterized sporulation protein YeaH/YhbH (DUF444 family)